MNIWTPKFAIAEPSREIILRTAIRGRFKLQALAPNRAWVRRETPWFDNLILDQGLDRLGQNSISVSTCHVGIGNTAPTVADSQLESPVATNGSLENEILATAAAPPYQVSKIHEFQFAEGDAEGNLAEVGVGWGTGATNLFSRALIRDSEGNPTTFPVDSDEFLNVAYQVIGFVPTVDVETSIDISGQSHDVVMRAANADAGWSFSSTTQRMFHGGGSTSGAEHIHRVYDGAIGAIDAEPSGTFGTSSSVANDAYTPGNFFTDWSAIWGLNDGNLVGGISASEVRMGRGTLGGNFEFQCSYSPDIVKTDTDILTLRFRHSWARADS